MKIVSREKFIALPCPQLFIKIPYFNDNYTGIYDFRENSLSIKTHSYPNDFIAANLVDLEFEDIFDLNDKIKKMTEGVEIELDTEQTCRDGMFEEKDLFVVFSFNDLNKIQAAISECREVFKEEVEKEKLEKIIKATGTKERGNFKI